MNNQSIVVLEDDPHQSETLKENLQNAFPNLGIVMFATEWEFREAIDRMDATEIACVILDAMVPWSFPSENMPVPPKEVQDGGIYLAGKRCADYVLTKFETKIPICVRTVLNQTDAGISDQGHVQFRQKAPSNGELIKLLKELIDRRQP
jgi:CheY-like chemotaxis protein